jgi:hypothetical protein
MRPKDDSTGAEQKTQKLSQAKHVEQVVKIQIDAPSSAGLAARSLESRPRPARRAGL